VIEGGSKMQLDKRNNPHLYFGIVVIHNHQRRLTKDILLNSTFITRDERTRQMPLLAISSEVEFSFGFPNTDDYTDVKGVVVHHCNNDERMGIWFKKIYARNKEFTKMFVLDYL
jgi:hypothetical protein